MYPDDDNTSATETFVPDYKDIVDQQTTTEQPDLDLGSDEVWRQQSKVMQENRERQERIRK